MGSTGLLALDARSDFCAVLSLTSGSQRLCTLAACAHVNVSNSSTQTFIHILSLQFWSTGFERIPFTFGRSEQLTGPARAAVRRAGRSCRLPDAPGHSRPAGKVSLLHRSTPGSTESQFSSSPKFSERINCFLQDDSTCFSKEARTRVKLFFLDEDGTEDILRYFSHS